MVYHAFFFILWEMMSFEGSHPHVYPVPVPNRGSSRPGIAQPARESGKE